MTLFAKSGSFYTPPSTGPSTMKVTLPFEPKAVIFKLTEYRSGPNQTITTAIAQGLGFAAGSPLVNGMWYGMHGITSAVARQSRSLTDSIQIWFSDVLRYCRGRVTSLDSDGFSLDFSDRNTSCYVEYLALGGSDITDAKVFTFQDRSTVGTLNVTGAGFRPKLAIFGDVWLGSTAELDARALSSSTRQQLSILTDGFGYATMNVANSAFNLSGFNQSRLRFDKALSWHQYTTPKATLNEAGFLGMTATGFDLDYTTVSGSNIRTCLALAGTFQVSCGSMVEPGTPSVSTVSTPFLPQAGLLMGQNNPPTTSIIRGSRPVDGDTSWGLWALDGGHYSDAWAMWVNSAGTLSSDASRGSDSKFEYITQAAGNTPVTAVDLDTSVDGAAKFNFSTVSGAGAELAYLLLGGLPPPLVEGGIRHTGRRAYPR